MKIEFEGKLLFAEGGDPRVAIVLLPGKSPEDQTMQWLAERWNGHVDRALFSMPRLVEIEENAHGAATDLDYNAAALDLHIEHLRSLYGLGNGQIVLAGFAEGMALALHYGLRQADPLCAIIGFSGNLQGFSDLGAEIKSRPPVIMIHGEKDPFVSPGEFLRNFDRLREAGVPASSCFRMGLDRRVDHVGADYAMFFLKGAHAARGLAPPKKRSLPENLEKAIKLVIWDLDDTLWRGTLDDSDTLELFEHRMEAIRRLNRSGIVSAICSKNDFETARAKLEELGIWDEFVFPRIAFVPKGGAIKTLISDMQLKPKNCLFIDDNRLNLEEAKLTSPELHTLDAKSGECDEFLVKLVDCHAHLQKSRVEEYRALESRVTEGNAFDGSRESFLQSCDIHIAITGCADLIDFAPRIEELINRSNQLNYLSTRVEPGSLVGLVSEPALREGFALFAWDKFGYHGLVGFVAVENASETLLHMAFSCRIMHMGIESALLEQVKNRFRNLQIPEKITVSPVKPDWITIESFGNPAIREKILSEERALVPAQQDVRVRIMACCQSGIFTHFAGLREVADVDNHPRVFMMQQVLDKSYQRQEFAPAVVHFLGNDGWDVFWPQHLRHQIDDRVYEECVREFCAFLKSNGSRLLVIGAPSVEAVEWHARRGITRERLARFADIWKRQAQINPDVDFLDPDTFLRREQIVDSMHLLVDGSREVGLRIRDWYDSLPESLFTPEYAVAV